MTSEKAQHSSGKKWKVVLQIFAAYLVAAWTFLEFIDWILSRYSLSPYWVDIFLSIFIGIIPSLLIYLYHRDRINQRVLLLREKIIFPLNFLLLAIGLYIGFGTTDLGATTKSIRYTTESGEERTALITKEEFRTGFNIYNFEPKTSDSTIQWLDFGISQLLYEDLLQNKDLSPDVLGITTTADKVRESSFFHDFYIDGDYDKTDSTYTINTYIRRAKDAKILHQETVTGTDILDLIDEITVFVANTFSSPEINSPDYLDLSIKEITSSNLEAHKYARYGDFENAIARDSTFALAYLIAGRRRLTFSQGRIEERKLADKAYQYRDRLPLQRRSEALVLKYLAYDQFDEAEKLVKIQLEVDPSSVTYNRTLRNIYGRTKNLEAYTALGYQGWENEKSRYTGVDLINASLIREDYDNILDLISNFARLQANDPAIVAFKMLPQILKGDLKEARVTLERFELQQPELSTHTRLYNQAITFLESHPVSKKDLQKYEGEYRSTDTEQVSKFWIHKNTLLQYTSNQGITPQVPSGERTLVAGYPNMAETRKRVFMEDSHGSIYGYLYRQYNNNDSLTSFYWKLDENIKKAEALLANRELEEAKKAYEKAINDHPNHYYLKDAMAHIEYMQSTDSTALETQLREVAGTYSKEGVESTRKFWPKEGRLLYKREGLPSQELLPISKTQYISLSNLRMRYEFEYVDGRPVASFGNWFNPETMSWVVNWNSDINYLPKD